MTRLLCAQRNYRSVCSIIGLIGWNDVCVRLMFTFANVTSISVESSRREKRRRLLIVGQKKLRLTCCSVCSRNNANVDAPAAVPPQKKEPHENIARIAKRYLDDNMQQAWINPRLISMVSEYKCGDYTVR